MPTLTAHKSNTTNVNSKFTTIELVPATAEDLKTVVGWEENGAEYKQNYKLRTGMIYWLYSNITNSMEPTPRIITSDTDTKELLEWLNAKMIYIAKNPFLE